MKSSMVKIASPPSKKQQPHNVHAKKVRSVAIGSIIVITGLLLFWLPIHNGSLYSADKDDVKASAQSVLDQVQPSGTQVYSDIVDLGCDSGNSVGLATVIHCELEGYKYFVNQGDLATNMRSLNTTLTNSGWKSSTDATVADRDERVLSGAEAGSVSYGRNKEGKAWDYIYLEHHKPGEPTYGSTIEQLMKDKKIPSDKEILGVRVTETYWSCRGDSLLLKYPCLFPPSKPTL